VTRHTVLAFAILLAPVVSQAQDLGPAPKVTAPPSVALLVPPSIPSEDIHIVYDLTGPFGGYGGDIDSEPNLHSYEIDASLNGKAATEAKLIVYAPGCEIQTFAIPLHADSATTAEFECTRVPTVTLSGQIEPSELSAKAQLDVTYEALWGDRFFGIMDGMVPQFRLASVRPDAEGRFQVNLPYFTVDSKSLESQSSDQSDFRLSLRDPDTGNSIAWNLEPELSDFVSETRGLEIRPFYPAGLKFKQTPSDISQPQIETPDNGSQP
jgi:hypothetical protein